MKTFCSLVARSVVNMTVDVHHILSWAVMEDEICDVTQFLVYIHKPDQPIAYSFEVDEPWVDVSFLEVCHEWIFVVVPVSQHTKGHEHRLFSSLPLPAGNVQSLFTNNFCLWCHLSFIF